MEYWAEKTAELRVEVAQLAQREAEYARELRLEEERVRAERRRAQGRFANWPPRRRLRMAREGT